MLEQRYNLLELLSDALREDGVYLRIGHEIDAAVAAGVLAGRGELRRGQPQPRHGERARARRAWTTSASSPPCAPTADSLSAYLEEIW